MWVLELHSLGIEIVPEHVETRASPTHSTTSNLVALGLTVWVYVRGGGQKIGGRLGPAPLEWGRPQYFHTLLQRRSTRDQTLRFRLAACCSEKSDRRRSLSGP